MKLIFKTTRTHIIISLVTIILARDASLKILVPRVLNRAVSLKRLINSMEKLWTTGKPSKEMTTLATKNRCKKSV